MPTDRPGRVIRASSATRGMHAGGGSAAGAAAVGPADMTSGPGSGTLGNGAIRVQPSAAAKLAEMTSHGPSSSALNC